MKGIITYYEDPGSDYSRQYAAGQFYWTLFPIVPETTQVRRIGPAFVDHPYDISTFNPETERPDRELQTASDELLIAIRYQRRPVLVLAPPFPHTWETRRKRSGDMRLVAPLYTLWDKVSNRYKYEPEFIWRAIAYYYNSVFHLEASDEYGISESIVRLDRACSLHTSWLSDPIPTKLTTEALSLLRIWFRYYVTDKLSKTWVEHIVAFRKMLIENDEQARTYLGQDKLSD